MEVVILYGLYLSTADRVSSPDIQKQIEVFFEQKEMQILCHLAVPLIHAFAFVASPPQKGDNANLHAKNLAENESNDVILLEMAMAFIRRMPPSLSGEVFVFNSFGSYMEAVH